MLKFIARWFPEVLLFVMAAYGVPPYIIALGPDGWVRFLSRAGCTQGCGLGPPELGIRANSAGPGPTRLESLAWAEGVSRAIRCFMAGIISYGFI